MGFKINDSNNQAINILALEGHQGDADMGAFHPWLLQRFRRTPLLVVIERRDYGPCSRWKLVA